MLRIFCFILFGLIFYSCHNGNYSFTETVKSIELGKDGYNAVIENQEGKKIEATISRNDMGFRYKRIEIGDYVKIYGDTSLLGNEISIHATKIKY